MIFEVRSKRSEVGHQTSDFWHHILFRHNQFPVLQSPVFMMVLTLELSKCASLCSLCSRRFPLASYLNEIQKPRNKKVRFDQLGAGSFQIRTSRLSIALIVAAGITETTLSIRIPLSWWGTTNLLVHFRCIQIWNRPLVEVQFFDLLFHFVFVLVSITQDVRINY